MQFMIDLDNDRTVNLRAIVKLITEACDARNDDVIADGPKPGDVFRGTTDHDELNGDAAALAQAAMERAHGVTDPPAPIVPPPPAATQHQLVTGEPNPSGAPRTVPPPPTTVDSTAVEVDSAGVAWDANTHSSSREKLKSDGTWKKRRGGPKKETPPPPPMTTAPHTASAATAVAQVPAAPAVAMGVVIPAPPTSTVPPPPPADATGATFRSVMAKATAATQVGKITAERVRELCKMAGAPDLVALNAMAHLIPQVDMLLDAELLGK